MRWSLLLALALLIAGCAGKEGQQPGNGKPIAVESLQGTYRFSEGYVASVLVLRPDHNFLEASEMCRGKSLAMGNWEQEGDGWLVLHYWTGQTTRALWSDGTLRFAWNGKLGPASRKESSSYDRAVIDRFLKPASDTSEKSE